MAVGKKARFICLNNSQKLAIMLHNFTKMQALGNDFVIFADPNHELLPQLTHDNIRFIADRHYGIGCDQVLIIQPSQKVDTFYYHVFNQNGNAAGQCLNGIRCAAWWAYQHNWCGESAQFQAPTTSMQTYIIANNWIKVDLQPPCWQAPQIPIDTQHPNVYGDDQHGYRILLKDLFWYCVNVGNPHAVACVQQIQGFPLQKTASQLEKQVVFPKGVNVGIMQIESANNIHLRVYERDVGETSACGSGACAAAIIGWHHYQVNSPVTVSLPGGTLVITQANCNHFLQMTGPAYTSFNGQIEL